MIDTGYHIGPDMILEVFANIRGNRGTQIAKHAEKIHLYPVDPNETHEQNVVIWLL